MLAPDNPLLEFADLPRFRAIVPAHVTPAVDTLLGEARAAVAEVRRAAAAPTWKTLVEPIADVTERLDRAWKLVVHLNAVMNSPALREAFNANLAKITDFYSELGQDEGLYAKYRALAQSADFAALPAERRRFVENQLRDFRLTGAGLEDAAKSRFRTIQEELASLAAKFDENLLDATDAFALFVDDADELPGVPPDAMELLAEQAKADGRGGFKITLKMPSYLPVIQYCDNRALRERLYEAHVTRASELGNPEWDNAPVIRRELTLRQESARLLGYPNFACVSLVPKMASSPEEVFAFLRDLARRARPFAERDLDELRAFAAAELGCRDLSAWDLAWASEKLRQSRYAFSENEVRQYFPEDRVLGGLFALLQRIYGIRVRQAPAETWHPTVRFFEVLDGGGALVGRFYLDLYARPAKRGGAWMDDAVNRRRTPAGVQTPVAFLTCNFPAPVGDRPALFRHEDVLTLFHEFGHGLHLLLTQIDTLGVSGLGGIEWDAVELPSQIMENFCWEREALAGMSAHVETGAPLPRALFDRMRAARNFQSGLQMLRQLEFALFDMRLHTDFDPQGKRSELELLDEVRREVAVVFPPPYNRFPASFGHIFAGGYAAGYYSYKWAEVLSADAFGAFEEDGVISPSAGARFRAEVLARGGSRPAMDSFVAFRGREPTLDALLRRSGMFENP